MTTPLIPYTFQDRTGTISLKELDANFLALANSVSAAPTAIFDGGLPSTVFANGAAIDAGQAT
jgi:hypothetical protein